MATKPGAGPGWLAELWRQLAQDRDKRRLRRALLRQDARYRRKQAARR